jgi:adenosylcobinamide kinase/adenosylcobinamide-phosphate guanylyltransferase
MGGSLPWGALSTGLSRRHSFITMNAVQLTGAILTWSGQSPRLGLHRQPDSSVAGRFIRGTHRRFCCRPFNGRPGTGEGPAGRDRLGSVLPMTGPRTLITGGVRSGKSRLAEDLLAGSPAVTYLAPGPAPDRAADPEWADRIDVHRARRPADWNTVETADLATAIGAAPGAVLVDCLGTWVTAVVDELGTWDEPLARWQQRFDVQLEDLLTAWQHAPGPLVAVTNEVGWSVVPEHRSGRTFRDLLGTVNQRMAAVSDDVLLVVAGRVLRL